MTDSSGQIHTVFIDLSKNTDKKLITALFGEGFSTTDNYDDLNNGEVDLIIMDTFTVIRNESKIAEIKKKYSPIFLPLIVLIDSRGPKITSLIEKTADDLIQMPVSREVLKKRSAAMLSTRMDSKTLEKQREKLEQRNNTLNIYFNAIESAKNGIIITDYTKEDNPIIFCNLAFEKLTGYNRREVLGKNCRFLQNNDTQQEDLKGLRESISEGKQHHAVLRNYKKDGTLFWNDLTVAPIKNDKGDIQFFVGIQNDITKQVRSKEKLQQARNQWQSIVTQSPNLIQISIGGEIKFINETGVKIFGANTAEEIIGTSVFDWVGPENHKVTKERLQAVEQGKMLPARIFEIITVEKKLKYLKVQSIPIEYQGKIAAQTVGQDITEIIEVQKKLENALEQKQTLMQEVHHRVKNNLAVISGLIDIQLLSFGDLENEQNSNLLRDTQSRILSIAKVHELLYDQQNLNEIDYEKYIRELTQTIKASLGGETSKISFNMDLTPLILSLGQAIPCGLLINELILSCVHQQDFKNKKKRIDLSIKSEENRVDVLFHFHGNNSSSKELADYMDQFGHTIVKTLLNQLNAEWEFQSNKGFKFSFRFLKKEHISYLK